MARPFKDLSRKRVLREVKRIRTRNNKLWMSLMEVAVTAKPRKAKKLIQKIVENDLLVSKWMGRI